MTLVLIAGATTAIVVAVVRGPGETAGTAVGSRAKPGGREVVGEEAPVVYDLSGERELAAVGWPDVIQDDQFWFAPGPRSVTVLLPGGRKGSYLIEKAILRRDGSKVVAIGLQFPGESLEQVYRRSIALAKLWDLRDPEKLDDWRAQRMSDGGKTPDSVSVLVFNDHSVPAVRLQIYRAYKVGEPLWWVQLSFGFAGAEPPTATFPQGCRREK